MFRITQTVVIDFIKVSAEYKYLFALYQIKCKKKGGLATLFHKTTDYLSICALIRSPIVAGDELSVSVLR
jgi:hypothetical protein